MESRDVSLMLKMLHVNREKAKLLDSWDHRNCFSSVFACLRNICKHINVVMMLTQ